MPMDSSGNKGVMLVTASIPPPEPAKKVLLNLRKQPICGGSTVLSVVVHRETSFELRSDDVLRHAFPRGSKHSVPIHIPKTLLPSSINRSTRIPSTQVLDTWGP